MRIFASGIAVWGCCSWVTVRAHSCEIDDRVPGGKQFGVLLGVLLRVLVGAFLRARGIQFGVLVQVLFWGPSNGLVFLRD